MPRNISLTTSPMQPDVGRLRRAPPGARNAQWFKPGPAPVQDGLTLFAFPYAGGSARVFDALAQALPARINLRAAELPGHGTRISEELVDEMDLLARAAASAIFLAIAPPRFALLGHSFGGSLAFAVAAELARQPGSRPEAVILCGANPPDRATPSVDGLAALTGPGTLPQEPVLRQAFETAFQPIIEADLCALAGFRQRMQGRSIQLNLPLHVCLASHDLVAPREGASQWQRFTTQPLSITVFDSDHFFVQSAPLPLAAHLARILPAQARPVA